MPIGLELWLFGVALGTSMLGGVLRMASGIFIVPVLTMFGRVDIHTAIGASLVSVIACSCGSAAPFLKERLTNIRLAILLETATTSGALCGVFLAGLIPTHYLYLLFAVILLLSAQQMLARRKDPEGSSSAREAAALWDARRLSHHCVGTCAQRCSGCVGDGRRYRRHRAFHPASGAARRRHAGFLFAGA